MSEEKKTVDSHPVIPDQIQKDHLVAFTYWTKVILNQSNDGHGNRHVRVRDLGNGGTFAVISNELIQRSKSADFFAEERHVCKTEVAKRFMAATNIPFTVCFTKQNGEERILRGRMIGPEECFGRSYVEDLDIPHGQNQIREVTHLALKWLIVDGVKYIVKK